ncbi:hypothetical protein F4777DRAFT_582030 [Nemania sp. FL0916]|nr:hypothetical protein F4777DRAFT_582030 [Nemania sp. FL0916]
MSWMVLAYPTEMDIDTPEEMSSPSPTPSPPHLQYPISPAFLAPQPNPLAYNPFALGGFPFSASQKQNVNAQHQYPFMEPDDYCTPMDIDEPAEAPKQNNPFRPHQQQRPPPFNPNKQPHRGGGVQNRPEQPPRHRGRGQQYEGSGRRRGRGGRQRPNTKGSKSPPNQKNNKRPNRSPPRGPRGNMASNGSRQQKNHRQGRAFGPRGAAPMAACQPSPDVEMSNEDDLGLGGFVDLSIC